MRKSVALRQLMQNAIRAEIAQRTDIHQSTIARLKAGSRVLAAAVAAGLPRPAPLVMLAKGDSWFDYPLSGNSYTFRSTDIISYLTSMGTTNPVILNIAHHGDATTTEMSLPKQERMIEALQGPDNWMASSKPDAILFSGGGDDIAGDQFCIYLDYAQPGITGLNAKRFQGILDMVRASYEDLFEFRNRYAPDVPVFAHCYDFPVPNGVHPDCGDPWLKPSLDYCGWNVEQGTAMCQASANCFRTMSQSLQESRQ